jgi:hypothetical protein
MSTKRLLLVKAAAVVLAAQAIAEPVATDSSLKRTERFQISTGAPQSIVQKGERLHLQTVVPLADNPPEVTVVDFGPRGWVLVSYERNLNVPSQGSERCETWINFDHVVAARKIASGQNTAAK